MVSQAELEERLEILMSYKGEGYRYMALVKTAMSLWGVSDSQARRYLSKIKKKEKKLAQASLDELWGEQVNQMNRLHFKALQEKDLHLARKILSDKTQVIVQIQKQGVNRHDKPKDHPKMSENELEAILDLFTKEETTQ